MKHRILDWITYILNILLLLPFFGIAAASVVGIIYYVLFQCVPGESASFIYVAGALDLIMAVFWGIYQYRIIIQKQARPKVANKISWLVLGVFILFILGIWSIAHWRTEIHINAENYQEFTAKIRSAKSLSIARRLVPEGGVNIAFFEKNKSFGHYMLVRCACSEDELQKFASERGYVFISREHAFSLAWQHFNPKDDELSTLPEKNLVYEDMRPNGSGIHLLYDAEGKILYSRWSNR